MYAAQLRKAEELSMEEIQTMISLTNVEIREAVGAARAAAEVNAAVIDRDSLRVFETLIAHSDSLNADVRPEVGDRYTDCLVKLQTAKRGTFAL